MSVDTNKRRILTKTKVAVYIMPKINQICFICIRLHVLAFELAAEVLNIFQCKYIIKYQIFRDKFQFNLLCR